MLRSKASFAVVVLAIAACRPSLDEPERTADELEQLAASEGVDPARQAAAARHRREAASLRDEEAHFCVGLSPEARDASPLDDASIEAVKDGYELVRYGRVTSRTLRGVDLEVRPERGMTRAWLRRVFACHLARHKTTVLHDSAFDPLAVGRPVVSVVESESGFEVVIRGRNVEEGLEIVRRARARLAAARSP